MQNTFIIATKVILLHAFALNTFSIQHHKRQFRRGENIVYTVFASTLLLSPYVSYLKLEMTFWRRLLGFEQVVNVKENAQRSSRNVKTMKNLLSTRSFFGRIVFISRRVNRKECFMKTRHVGGNNRI